MEWNPARVARCGGISFPASSLSTIQLKKWLNSVYSLAQNEGLGPLARRKLGGQSMDMIGRLWREDQGQDIAEYAVMLAVILVLVVGTVRLVGTQSNTVFSQVASSIQ